jgi:NAD(P)-dependent dehydrogenase (short-subunit alcohol dehydrogenase family)
MILQDKVALVTGGTSGIGRATAMSSTSRFASTPLVLRVQKWCSVTDPM